MAREKSHTEYGKFIDKCYNHLFAINANDNALEQSR